MKVQVDMALCQLHGQCIYAAPNVFSFDDKGDLVYDGTPSDAEFADVEEAADVCPVQAILIHR